MTVTLQETQAGGMTVRLIERNCCDFVILYITSNFAKLHAFTGDCAEANETFDTAVDLANFGFTHPAWKPRTIHIPINTYNGE